MSRPKLRIAQVEWIDACSHGNWKDTDLYEKITHARCVSVGYIIVRNKERVTLLQSLDSEGKGCDSITIPTKCVRKFRLLK